MGHLRAIQDRKGRAHGRAARSTTEVMLDHLECRRRKAVDEDLERNDASNVVVLSPRVRYRVRSPG